MIALAIERAEEAIVRPATNALLRHLEPSDPDDLADLAVDEPRRVVVAVAAARAIDEHDVVGTDLLPPVRELRFARERPEPCGTLLLLLAG